MKDYKVPTEDFPVSSVDGAPLTSWIRGPE